MLLDLYRSGYRAGARDATRGSYRRPVWLLVLVRPLLWAPSFIIDRHSYLEGYRTGFLHSLGTMGLRDALEKPP